MGLFGDISKAVGGIGSTIGGLFSSQDKTSSKSKTNESQQYQYGLAPATQFQEYAEPALLNLFNQYNQGGQAGLANQTTNLMQQLLGYGMNATPQQNALFEGQTSEFMKGLLNQLGTYQKGAMSQATQSGLARGLGQSDIARGMEANVYGQGQNLLSQGYTQAKMQELANKLQYPMQNLQMMAGLQQMYNQPLLATLLGSGTQRQPVQMGQTGASTTQSSSTATSTPSPFDIMGKVAKIGLGGMAGGMKGALGGFS